MNTKRISKSPLRYPGGKTRAVHILGAYIPEGTQSVCSPFFGGGSFELHLTKRGIRISGYDYFEQLCIFWNELLDSPGQLADLLEDYYGNTSKETFNAAQKRLIDMEGSNREIARDFFIVNRSSFSGATLSGGYSKMASEQRFNESSVFRVRNFRNDLVSVTYSDALDVIPKSEEDVLFLDPPYLLESSSLYGVRGDKHKDFDHESFYEAVIESEKPFLLTYNNHPDIKKLWSDFDQVETSWSYGMNSSKQSSELIIHHGLVKGL